MLLSLKITNLAVIESVEVALGSGLNLLTGETGSGKSIVVDSLQLLMGARPSPSDIRSGRDRAIIEGRFVIPQNNVSEVRALLDDAELEFCGTEVVLRKELSTTGRSRTLIADQVAPAGVLRKLQPYLVDIYGQVDQHILLSAASQRDLLDEFAGALTLKEAVSCNYARLQKLVSDLEKLRTDLADRERAEDYLKFQLQELQNLNLQPGEEAALENQRRSLVSAGRLAELGGQAFSQLYEDDGSVLAILARVRKKVEEISRIDNRLESTIKVLESAEIPLEEASHVLRHYAREIEFSPGKLDEIEARLAEVDRLKRKYRVDVDGLISLKNELDVQVNSFEKMSDDLKALETEIDDVGGDYRDMAQRLSGLRKTAAEELSDRVTDELRTVAMPEAKLVVKVKSASEPDSLADNFLKQGDFYSAHGSDRVEFLLAANPGEDFRPFATVTSGGELSRLMLSLRTVVMGSAAQSTAPETIVFDEIDSGIGGRVAEAVGVRLKRLSENRQVLCVTHQPQIARFADHHFAVSKTLRDGRTVTHVEELDHDGRIRELSRMLGGSEDIKETRETAHWMLESRNGLALSTKPRRSKSAVTSRQR